MISRDLSRLNRRYMIVMSRRTILQREKVEGISVVLKEYVHYAAG
jgi:hypothetical protein